MGILERVFKRFGYVKPSPRRRRNYAAAAMGRLFSSWATNSLSGDAELFKDRKAIVARARDLARNQDHVKRFINLMRKNVVGHTGIWPQSLAETANGKPDDGARKKIEEAFRKWAKKGTCEITGKYSLTTAFQLIVATLVKDGELFIRHRRGAKNAFGYAFQLIESDHVDDTLNTTLDNGNEIKMGIELNPDNRPVAYHVLRKHPGEYAFGEQRGESIRIPADEMIHVFIPERISQNRGVSMLAQSMPKIKNLDGYDEAAVVAARLAASKMIFYTEPEEGGEYKGDEIDDDDAAIYDIEPAVAEILKSGWDVKTVDFNQPNNAYSEFVKAQLKAVAAGLDVAYHQLSGDLEKVNYTSSRTGELDSRDTYRSFQTFIVETVAEPLFMAWVEMALLTKAVNLPINPDAVARWEKVRFITRGWDWVDPEKDLNAAQKAIELGVKTATDIAAESGSDFEENIKRQAKENAIRQSEGVELAEV